MLAVLGLMLQVAGAPYARMPGVDSVPRDVVVDSLRTAETRFLMAWRREWMGGQRSAPSYLRLASLHCHYDGSWQSGAPNIIRGRQSSRSFCPIWFAVDDSLPSDETEGVDASLREAGRVRMRRARGELIERFTAAARSRMDNAWLVGQLVRLQVDQGDHAAALATARSCTSSSAWCLLLEGYALHVARREALADSTFLRAVAAMRPADRCEWNSIALLLDPRARAAYERIDCSARDSVHATYWWLADPLYIDPGNARRAEHFARNVLVRLHAGLTIDERWDWRPKYGGDALATMIVRYGWPAHLYWAGYREDGGHFEWLGFRDSSINVAPEYALPRFRATPEWRAVLDPATLSAADWSRFSPRAGHGSVEWETDHWPTEHWRRIAGPIMELPDQTVIFRRDTDAFLAIGLDLPQRFFGPGVRIPYDAAIVAARDATDRWVPSRESLLLDGKGTTVLTSPLSARAQIVSAELAPADGAPGMSARARRAVRPPPPLSTMRDGEIAISDPLFFRPARDARLPLTADSAIARMLGSLTLSEPRVGIFWETYGIAPTDSVEVRLRLTSIDRPGLLRRVGSSIGVIRSRGGEIAMTWTERTGRREGLSFAGDVAIQARSVVLDVSRLRPGRYSMELTVTRRGSAPAITKREVAIAR